MRRTGTMRRGTAGSSPEERQRSLSDWGKRISGAASGKLTQAGLVAGKSTMSKGNVTGKPVQVTFPGPSVSVFVAHGLGYTVLNFEVLSTTPAAKIGRSGKQPTRLGIWLHADVACKATIRCYGDKGQEPRRRT